MNDEIQQLLSLLDKASEEMLSFGETPTFSYFDTCADVGLFIQNITKKARGGELEEISRLWYIFTPTSVWDDSGGSQDIANEIFEIINRNFQPTNKK